MLDLHTSNHPNRILWNMIINSNFSLLFTNKMFSFRWKPTWTMPILSPLQLALSNTSTLKWIIVECVINVALYRIFSFFSPSLFLPPSLSLFISFSLTSFSLSPSSLSLSQSPSCLPPFTLFLHILGDNNRLDDNKSV